MRGEQSLTILILSPNIGSPPLARGTVGLFSQQVLMHRITPACAGNSDIYRFAPGDAEDHPRLRGEQASLLPPLSAASGSPPLARGTGLIFHKNRNFFGITPACAGNSAWTILGLKPRRDHPRLRGEQGDTWAEWPLGVGSPPLARGTEKFLHLFAHTLRITPACAGNSFWCLVATAGRRDHPRLRGEQTVRQRGYQGHQGSPPLARGTVSLPQFLQYAIRITPACAGNRPIYIITPFSI